MVAAEQFGLRMAAALRYLDMAESGRGGDPSVSVLGFFMLARSALEWHYGIRT